MFKNIPIKTVDNSHEYQYDNEQLLTMIHGLMDERDVLWRENEYLKAKLNESLLMETINEMKKERDLLLKLLLNLTVQNQDKTEHVPYSNSYIEEHTNGYPNDLLPPSSHQTFSTTPNGKFSQSGHSPSKKPAAHPRHSLTTREVHPAEVKPSRRLHRVKPNSDQQQQQQQQQPTVVYRVEGTKECLMNPNELSSVFAHVKHSHPNKKIVVYKTSTTPQTHEFNQLVDEMCLKHGVELKHSHNSPFQQYRSQSLQDLTSTSSSLPFQHDFDFQFQPIEKQEQIRGNHIKKFDSHFIA